MADLSPGPAPISQTIDDRILVRGHDLVDELIGRVGFTEMFLLDLHGEIPPPAHVRVVEAVLVTTMEHGITPSTLTARLVLDGAPESTQGAVAAGLLACGSRFVGVTEQVAEFLREICAAAAHDTLETVVRTRVGDVLAAGGKVPGFGHNLHHRIDPRVARLVELAKRENVFGTHLTALHEVERCLSASSGPPLLMNAAGVTGALLSDLGYAPSTIRGLGLVARCAGLLAHVVDEQRRAIGRDVWQRAHETFGEGES
ncbi:citryl-CoA lyase [Amycolatopsis ultiminotia]|uniref:Citryl-CoA lyase n=1 Tax=Amycolatopsis ultiminotia TaxID=543629 RepID=A0ABP6W3B3_9PSEU